jgi:hypothetical protein
MSRARNIKPGFFRNADLVELPFEVRLLFIGLWTLADRAGRLIDRPKQIKMEIFPADNVDCNAALDLLAEIEMIERYEVNGKQYIQIVNFLKHQNPHQREPESIIPDNHGNMENPGHAPVQSETVTSLARQEPSNKSHDCQSQQDANPVPASDQPCASPMPAPDQPCVGPVLARLIPDSGFLIPDSGFRIPDSSPAGEKTTPPLTPPQAGGNMSRVAASRGKPDAKPPPGFAEFWAAYPRKVGKGAAEKLWGRLKPDLPTVLKAIERARATEQWRKDEGQYIPHPATWLGQRRWEDEPDAGRPLRNPSLPDWYDGPVIAA